MIRLERPSIYTTQPTVSEKQTGGHAAYTRSSQHGFGKKRIWDDQLLVGVAYMYVYIYVCLDV